jgi:nitroreductase
MPLGEAMFTQRSIRRFRPDRVPIADLELIMEAAVKAPNGGNRQLTRFLMVDDPALIAEFGAIYRDAWWAKRGDEGVVSIDQLEEPYRSATRLAEAMGSVPCVVFAFALDNGAASSVVPAVQNLMLAARALGIGSVPTTLHPSVMERFRVLFGVPEDAAFHLCIPMGYPQGNFGPTTRLATTETTFHDRWGAPPPWA